jgi:DNA-binding response OmpR family regulator
LPKVLLIEDEEGLGEALEYQLGREGYEVERATNGAVGLERFKASGGDLVLLDLMLPGMPGDEVCKQIRRNSNVPIIMLTARDTEIDKVLGLELGADDYITKPFSTRELLARIKAVLRGAAPPPRRPPTAGSWREAGSGSTPTASRSPCGASPCTCRAKSSSYWSCSWRTPVGCSRGRR